MTDQKKTGWGRWASPIFGLALFCLAAWYLSRELQKYRLEDIFHQMTLIPFNHVVIACVITVLGHALLVSFDVLGLIYIRRRDVPLTRVTLACLVSYVLSHNIGSWSGAPFRLRVYREEGLSILQIAAIVAWCGVTFWLGFLFLGGVLLETVTEHLTIVYSLSPVTLRSLGAVFLGIIFLYVFGAATRKRPIRIFKWELSLPAPGLAVAQILASTLDWILAATVFYFLFPEGASISYISFLGVFVLAQASGFTSQIPGGLGVFETIFITLLTPAVPPETVLGTLLAYRGLYYVIPLLIGVVALGYYEFILRPQTRKLKPT